MSLPERTRPGDSRTVWVEIDVEELDEVRAALSSRAGYFAHLVYLAGPLDDDEVADANRREKIARAVLARLPDDVAMRRRYP